jgi:hypothetical protein
MTRRGAIFLAGLLCLSTSCKNFLDVNTNPNAPQTVSANLYLPPMLHWMVTSPQFDGRYIGEYAQEWVLPGSSISVWAQMGYVPASDAGAQQWRDVYWSLGQNLIDMNTIAEREQRWDLLGVGMILKAWGWQVLTDLHGEIIIKEAFDQTRHSFDYDTQEYAYQVIDSLLNRAIELLQRTDGAVDQSYLAVGDHIYNGDRTKWLKLAYGMLAIHHNHFSNRPTYDPASVVALVDQSFTSNADDALLAYPGETGNDDRNFLGRTRDNLTRYRQTQFIVHLMDGTQFGGVVDPRLSRMLAPSPDGRYRGLDPNEVGYGALTDPEKPNNFFGYPGTGGLQQPGRYIFDDKAKLPVVTYSQLQFVKAEAAYRMGDKTTALAAYINGISSHIDFVNARNMDNGQSPTQITPAEKAAFLSNPAIVPTAANLTLSHIMSQKYIALWGWGHNELWMDLRRYHYLDMDPVSGTRVFRGFELPEHLYPDNNDKPVQRLRPRYNSEYVWNQDGLRAIGGLDPDYHTRALWITSSQP